MKLYKFSDKGKFREKNEDYILAINKKVNILDNLYILCDGVGGNKAGEVASKSAANYFAKYIKKNKDKNVNDTDIRTLLYDALSFSSYNVKSLAEKNKKRSNMCTTIVACTFYKNKLHAISVGDSRLYMITLEPNEEKNDTIIERKSIVQISQDDTQVLEEVIKPKEINFGGTNQELFSRKRKVLTKAVGLTPSVQGNYYEIDLNKKIQEGKKVYFVLCSDGIYDGLNENDILTIISDDKYKNKAKDLVKESIRKGSRDNVSTIVIEV